MDEQERTIQGRSVGEHAALAIAIRIFRGQTEVTLGVMRVVVFPGHNRRARHCAAMRIEVCGEALPIEIGNALGNSGARTHRRVGNSGADHETASRSSRARLRSMPQR